MKRNPNLLWGSALVLGWLFDFLFWKQSLGLNFAIYSVLCVAGGFIILLTNQQRPSGRALWLLPVILFFASTTVMRAEPLTLFLGILFTLFLMSILAITFIGGRWFWYSLADYASGFLKLAGSMLARPLSFASEVKREKAESGATTHRLNPWPIIRGIIIALPIVAIFASLLASADVVFSNQLDLFIKFFRIENLPQYIFRLIYILFGAYLLSGVFLHAAYQSKDEKLLGQDKPLMEPFLGFTESTIVLGSVIALFAAFVVVQFRYFFGGQGNINIEGFTYSEYARRGFGELLIVAFFSLLMILGLGAVTQRKDEAQRRLFSGLSVTVVALVMVILVSAYQRLTLYEVAYGFSRLRTYTHVVLIWIGILLGAVVVMEIMRRERAFAAAALIASLGFAISLYILNVDAFIVRQNANRATHGEDLDVSYLASLSTDSVPELVNIFQSPAYPVLTRDAVGAALFCRLQFGTSRPSIDWRSFSLSSWRSDTGLDSVRTLLARYQVLDSDWPIRILTPGNVTYSCYESSPD